MSFIIIIIALALIFDYINGFHDAANSIATIVSTKVLSPGQAVVWAAFFNFVAFFIFSDHHVANTIAKIVHKEYITLPVIFAGLVSAIIWNLLTWWYAIPSSSSHALIGGFAGAALAHASTLDSINIEKITKTIAFILLAPLIGMFIAMIFSVIFSNNNFWKKGTLMIVFLSLLITFVHFSIYLKIGIAAFGVLFLVAEGILFFRKSNATRYGQFYKRLQLLSSAAFSLGHGGNDAQKVMGIIAAALVANGNISSLSDMPAWVPLACYTAIGLGTLSGGWKIVKTMGTKITKVTPLEGVCAENAGAITLFLTESLGIPVSTTHTVTGAIIGVGATKRLSAVRWGVTINLLWAWIITIPISGLLAAVVYWVSKLFYA